MLCAATILAPKEVSSKFLPRKTTKPMWIRTTNKVQILGLGIGQLHGWVLAPAWHIACVHSSFNRLQACDPTTSPTRWIQHRTWNPPKLVLNKTLLTPSVLDFSLNLLLDQDSNLIQKMGWYSKISCVQKGLPIWLHPTVLWLELLHSIWGLEKNC